MLSIDRALGEHFTLAVAGVVVWTVRVADIVVPRTARARDEEPGFRATLQLAPSAVADGCPFLVTGNRGAKVHLNVCGHPVVVKWGNVRGGFVKLHLDAPAAVRLSRHDSRFSSTVGAA